MSEINEQVPSTTLPIEKFNCCMYCPMRCENYYMLWDQMLPNYYSENPEDEEEYRPVPVKKPALVKKPVPVKKNIPIKKPSHKVWHEHGGYYGNKYYKDINYFYYLKSRYYLHFHYPYDPYFDYYNNTY
jgi:hypothetical protein